MNVVVQPHKRRVGGQLGAGDFIVAFQVGDEDIGAVAGDRHTLGFGEESEDFEEGDLAGVEVDASNVVASTIGDEDQGSVRGEGHAEWFVEPGIGEGGGDFVGLEVDEGDAVCVFVGDDGVPAVGGYSYAPWKAGPLLFAVKGDLVGSEVDTAYTCRVYAVGKRAKEASGEMATPCGKVIPPSW